MKVYVEYYVLTEEVRYLVEEFNLENAGTAHLCISTINGIYCIEKADIETYPIYTYTNNLIDSYNLEKITHSYDYEDFYG